jgi:Uma2 family endonuclease
MSYDDYLAWADGSVIAEWVEGEVIVNMPAKDRHQRVVVLLATLMNLFAGVHQLGVVRVAPFEVRVRPGRSSREPDLLFVSTQNLHRLNQDRFEGGPDLIVEVVSTDSVTRDNHDKVQEYQEAGVREYWIVDPRPRVLQIHLRRLDAAGRYQRVDPDATGVLRSEVLAGFWVQAGWLWQDPSPSPLALFDAITGRADG